MGSLNWKQVNNWRMEQHQLLDPLNRPDSGRPAFGKTRFVEVVKRIGGVHAQLMSSAELALWTRVEGFSAADLKAALWQEHTLIKTWAMRGTLHLLPNTEFPLYSAARSATPIHRPPSYYSYHGVTPQQLEAILEAIPEVLSDTPLTREQLAEAVAERAHEPDLRQVLLSGWGALLKPSAFRGDLCFGPNQGQNVTFVRPDGWAGSFSPAEPQEALQELTRRYLEAYGPAAPEDFARWWGCTPAQAKKAFRSLEGEIEAVEVEGWKAWALASTLHPLKAAREHNSIRLLPQFDAYVVGVGRDCEAIVPQTHKNLVFRPQGWISAVVVNDGRVDGVWEYDRQGAKTTLQVQLFHSSTTTVERGIEAAAERLAKFWDSEVEVTYVYP